MPIARKSGIRKTAANLSVFSECTVFPGYYWRVGDFSQSVRLAEITHAQMAEGA